MADEGIKFYLDEHVPRAVAQGLRRRGVDVLTPRDAGMMGAADEDHLALAVHHGRVIFTQDVDFLRLCATGRTHAGVAYAPQYTGIGRIVAGLMLLYEVMTPADMANHVEFL